MWTYITAYRTPLAPVTSFNYLGIFLAAADDNWPELVHNLWRAWQKWARLTRMLRKESADDSNSGQIYLAVAQSVLIYGSETLVMTLHIGRVLGRFHHQVAHRLTWRKPQRWQEIVWVYPLLEDAITEARLQEVKTYVSRRENTVTHFISPRPIMDLCMPEERRPGSMMAKRWW